MRMVGMLVVVVLTKQIYSNGWAEQHCSSLEKTISFKY
jgi:hypothetical protein